MARERVQGAPPQPAEVEGVQVLGSQPRGVEIEGGLERHGYPPPVEGEF